MSMLIFLFLIAVLWLCKMLTLPEWGERYKMTFYYVCNFSVRPKFVQNKRNFWN